MESENLGELWVTVYIGEHGASVDIQDVCIPILLDDAKALLAKFGSKGTG